MDFRYQEVLTWIVPGFYLIVYSFGIAYLIIPDEDGMNSPERWFTGLVNGGDALMALMLFAVPILSLIVGWLVNCYGGLLFRHIFKSPFVKAYKKVTRDNNATLKKAEDEFDRVRECIDLEKVDRFYYRYVFSRNMFTTQAILTLGMFILLAVVAISMFFGFDFLKGRMVLIITLVTIVIGGLYLPCVDRDLFTHSKYVFLSGRKENVLKTSIQNQDNQQTD